MLHPSAQVGQYQLYLEDSHTAFYEGGPSQTPVDLSSCAYLGLPSAANAATSWETRVTLVNCASSVYVESVGSAAIALPDSCSATRKA